jgi:hypothetical protein
MWAMALLFAVAPALSMGFAAPTGAFSRIVFHAHDHGHEPHSHHAHCYAYDYDGQDRNAPSTFDSGQPNHHDQNRSHIHHDACLPSVLVPVLALDVQEHRVGDAFSKPQTRPMQGSSPDRLLRPPIFQLNL